MNIKIIPLSDSAIQLLVDGADYSVSDIVHKELLGVKHVKFAGVAPPHPLIKVVTIQIHTDGGASPKSVLGDAITASQERASELLAAAKNMSPKNEMTRPAENQVSV